MQKESISRRPRFVPTAIRLRTKGGYTRPFLYFVPQSAKTSRVQIRTCGKYKKNVLTGRFFLYGAGEGIYSLTLTLRVAVPALPALALRLNPIL